MKVIKPGQRIKIPGVSSNALITQVMIEMNDVGQYKVAYTNGSKRETEWLYEDEISGYSDTQTISIGFK